MASTPAARIAVSCALKSLSPSAYFGSATTSPPPSMNAFLKNFARPTLYAEVELEKIATRLEWSLVRANLAITGPWKGSMKHTRKM